LIQSSTTQYTPHTTKTVLRQVRHFFKNKIDSLTSSLRPRLWTVQVSALVLFIFCYFENKNLIFAAASKRLRENFLAQSPIPRRSILDSRHEDENLPTTKVMQGGRVDVMLWRPVGYEEAGEGGGAGGGRESAGGRRHRQRQVAQSQAVHMLTHRETSSQLAVFRIQIRIKLASWIWIRTRHADPEQAGKISFRQKLTTRLVMFFKAKVSLSSCTTGMRNLFHLLFWRGSKSRSIFDPHSNTRRGYGSEHDQKQ
jgi:hypothetical protein